jgi:hypothetical protein
MGNRIIPIISLTLFVLAGALAAYFHYLSFQEVSLEGLTPLNIPIRCMPDEVTRAHFRLEYDVDHNVYVFSEQNITNVDILGDAKKRIYHPLLDIEWKIRRGSESIASGSGAASLLARDNKGIIIGRFHAKPARDYELEVKVGEDFAKLKAANPRLEINVGQPSISVGLQYDPLIYSFLAYASGIISVVFFGIFAIVFWIQRYRRRVPLKQK